MLRLRKPSLNQGNITKYMCLCWLACAGSLAEAATPHGTGEDVCATLQSFEGRVELLDPSRKNLRETALHTAIPCGGWVSVEKGWALVHLRSGHMIQAGPWSFVQLASKEVVLFRGKLYGQADGGDGELKLITPNARARVVRGKVLLLFSQSGEESQLITLENRATIENRLQSSDLAGTQTGGRITVKEGEASSLNLKALRTVPTTPRVAPLASVRARLSDLYFSDLELALIMKNVQKRQDRKFAAILTADTSANRAPAGLEIYARHQPSRENAKLNERLEKKVVSRHSEMGKLLYPNETPGRARSVRVEVEDKAKTSDNERKRLMEELSQLKPD